MRIYAFAAVVTIGIATLAGCSSGGEAGRPGRVSEANYTGLEASRPSGVALFASWRDSPGVERVEVGDRNTAPKLLQATCYGDGADLRIRVEAPGGAVLHSSADRSTVEVGFPGLVDSVELDIATYDMTWSPTGMEVDLFRSDFGSSASGGFPKEFGKASGTLNIRMTVTC